MAELGNPTWTGVVTAIDQLPERILVEIQLEGAERHRLEFPAGHPVPGFGDRGPPHPHHRRPRARGLMDELEHLEVETINGSRHVLAVEWAWENLEGWTFVGPPGGPRPKLIITVTQMDACT